MDEEDETNPNVVLRRQTSFLHNEELVDARRDAIQRQQAIEVLIPYLQIKEQGIKMSEDGHHINTKTNRAFPSGEPFYHTLAPGKRRLLNFLDRLNLTQKLLYALRTLADRNVIHGAISCGTILVDEDNARHVYIVDFKHARMVGDKHFPSYSDDCFSAPEILKRENPSLKSDVYSLGIVLALLWGVPNPIVLPSLATLRAKSSKWVPGVNLELLFYNMKDPMLTKTHQKAIKNIISGMICIQNKRLSLNKVINCFERLEEAIRLEDMDIPRTSRMNCLCGCFSFFAKSGSGTTTGSTEDVELLMDTREARVDST